MWGKAFWWVDVGKRGSIDMVDVVRDGDFEILGDENKMFSWRLLSLFYQFKRAKLRFQQPQMIASEHDFVVSASTVLPPPAAPSISTSAGARTAGRFSHCPIRVAQFVVRELVLRDDVQPLPSHGVVGQEDPEELISNIRKALPDQKKFSNVKKVLGEVDLSWLTDKDQADHQKIEAPKTVYVLSFDGDPTAAGVSLLQQAGCWLLWLLGRGHNSD